MHYKKLKIKGTFVQKLTLFTATYFHSKTHITLESMVIVKNSSIMLLYAGAGLVWVQWVQLHPQILRKTDFALTDFEEI